MNNKILPKKTGLIPILMLISIVAWSQERTVSGRVTSSEDNASLPGVNVVVKGTTNGTVTDSNGEYRLEVPEAGGTLIFSFIGFITQEVEIGARATVDVLMGPDVRQLGEVVVTALGVEKSSRSLGYSVTKVNAEEVTKARTPSVLSSLQGKIAGVQITGSSGAPGSSSKVIIRGFTSLTGGNNPLYIVDGIPVNNYFTGTSPTDALNGASDFGSRINDINPEDIESISVLKGAAATQLYGSRAAAGVIVITTKKGKDAALRGKKAEVTVASSVVFDDVLKLPTFQNERGQGFYGSTSRFLDENTSWGSKFDGQNHPWGRVVNNQQRVKPFVALEDNVKEFFEIGKTITNSVSLQGGNASSSYYLSYSNVNADGIMPTDADSYKRNTLSLRGATELSNKIGSSASINYARTKSSFVPTGQGSTVYNYILQTPRDIPLLELEDITNPFNDPAGYYSPFTENPWYIIKEFNSDATIDRLYGNVELTYDPLAWLNFLARIGSDVSFTEWEQWQPKNIISGPNASNSNAGMYSIQTINAREFNADLIANINKDLGANLALNGLVGFNVNQRQYKTLFSQINDLVIPGYYNLANTANTPISNTTDDPGFMRRLYGVYAQANFSFRDYLFLALSARNDWSSTLPKENNSFFYPSVSLGFDVTSALGMESNTLNYAKVRAAWSQAGKDAGPYLVHSVFRKGFHEDGYIQYDAPYGQSIPGFSVEDKIGNANLKPELSTDIEFGLELQLFNNNVRLDATYYDRQVEDNILAIPITASSGYNFQVLNIAQLSNKGMEFLLGVTPVRSGAFSWDVTLNWSRNRSRIIDLGGSPQIPLGGLGSNGLIARVGGPAFEIEGDVPLLDPQGRVIVDGAGKPIPNPDKQVIGNTNYKWMGGVTNQLRYKGVSLSGTFDVRKGGVLYSRAANLVHFSGTTPATLYNDRRPFVIPNSVVAAVDDDDNPILDDQGNQVYYENTTPILDSDGSLQNFWEDGGFNLDKSFLVDKSFVKLREVVLSYSIPAQLLSRTPFGAIDISLIGRNLLLWVPEENVFIDPEQTTFGTDFRSEFGEFGASPTTRSYGFNVRLTL